MRWRAIRFDSFIVTRFGGLTASPSGANLSASGDSDEHATGLTCSRDARDTPSRNLGP